MPDAASLHGLRVTGFVRNFKETWGFLNSDAFDGDLFVGLRGNPHITGLAQGDQVEFEVQVDDKGKAQAVSVIPTMKGPNSTETDGTRYNGWVRSFRGDWGFINSNAISGDLFVGLKSNKRLANLREGDQVSFEVKNEASKPEAVNVVLVSHASLGVPTTTTAPMPSLSLVQSTGPSVRAQVGHLMGHELMGRIKNFKDTWGFVVSESFDGDLFIHQKNNPQLGKVGTGDPVKFEVAEDQNSIGNFNAVNAQVLKEDLLGLVGQHLRGVVKSFKSGWGFINSQRFDGDLFVGHKANNHLELMGLQPGEAVEFEVVSDAKSDRGAQAVNVKRVEALPMAMSTAVPMMTMAPGAVPGAAAYRAFANAGRGVKRPEELVGNRVHGTIRSFRESWGFVVSEAFEGDLFLHQGSNPGILGLQAGTSILFDISMGAGGRAHATSVQVAPPGPDSMVGQRCRGQVRSFRDTWGFVVSSDFYGDLFFGTRSNPALASRSPKEGDQVEFTVAVQQSANSPKPQYEAVQVAFVNGAAYTQGFQHRSPVVHAARDHSRTPRPAGARSGDAHSYIGHRLEGWIRSYKGEWGFVNSSQFTGDLFVGAKYNTNLVGAQVQPNQRISFEVSQGTGGKLEAINVQLMH
mmetsp:Transcript_6207/g.11271  ORF Transcript_6207/g.11271 Transcript_6207/m.11271 type:complete len:632 (-) Transcript_6207:36-1931(-)